MNNERAVYVQFATELPVAGSSFTYVVASLGQVPAFLVMVNMVRPYSPLIMH